MLAGIGLFHLPEIRKLFAVAERIKSIFAWLSSLQNALNRFAETLGAPVEEPTSLWLSPFWEIWASPIATLVAAGFAVWAARQTINKMTEQIAQTEEQIERAERAENSRSSIALAAERERLLIDLFLEVAPPCPETIDKLNEKEKQEGIIPEDLDLAWRYNDTEKRVEIYTPEKQSRYFTTGDIFRTYRYKGLTNRIETVISLFGEEEVRRRWQDKSSDVFYLASTLSTAGNLWVHLLTLVEDAIADGYNTSNAASLLGTTIGNAEVLCRIGVIDQGMFERAVRITNARYPRSPEHSPSTPSADATTPAAPPTSAQR